MSNWSTLSTKKKLLAIVFLILFIVGIFFLYSAGKLVWALICLGVILFGIMAFIKWDKTIPPTT